MRILGQLGLLFGFGYLGVLLSRVLPITLPASILGMLLLLAALRLRLLSERSLAETGEFLGANMAFFFLPPAVDILEQYPLVRAYLPNILLICLLTTMATFLAAYLAARAAQQWTGKDV